MNIVKDGIDQDTGTILGTASGQTRLSAAVMSCYVCKDTNVPGSQSSAASSGPTRLPAGRYVSRNEGGRDGIVTQFHTTLVVDASGRTEYAASWEKKIVGERGICAGSDAQSGGIAILEGKQLTIAFTSRWLTSVPECSPLKMVGTPQAGPPQTLRCTWEPSGVIDCGGTYVFSKAGP
jgi:hypothetical protein